MYQHQPVLYASLRSPFARRIRLALHRLGITYEEKMVDVFQFNPELFSANPLGLVPTLLSEFGPISDSMNILEYLDETYGGIWPMERNERIQERQVSIWAEGIMQSLVLYFQESKLHEVPSPRWLKDHTDSIIDTLKHLSQSVAGIWFTDRNGSLGLTQAGWDLAVALEYMDLRLPELEWKQKFPVFIQLIQVAQRNEYFRTTTPPL
jgi:glutathione S-transferase